MGADTAPAVGRIDPREWSPDGDAARAISSRCRSQTIGIGSTPSSTRITDSTRKLDRRGPRADEQLETELLLTKVDNLADEGLGIGLRERQDPIKIVSLRRKDMQRSALSILGCRDV
jgi:hypothetical protein